MSLPNVRRLAAVDMWGSAGTRRRRALVRAEFDVGAVVCTLLGVLALRSGTYWELALGAWLVGAGANYVPLAVHAHSLSRPGALEVELGAVDLTRELRWATFAQLWIAVPLVLVAAALAQARR